jgi:hypothetical protein
MQVFGLSNSYNEFQEYSIHVYLSISLSFSYLLGLLLSTVLHA